MSTCAIYPGSFDPLTNGHVDIILRAAQLFDKLFVGLADNTAKSSLLPFEKRVQLTRDVCRAFSNVEVVVIPGLLVDFMKERDIKVIVRGLRSAQDFDYEFQLAGMNKVLAPEIESVFLTPSEKTRFISSTWIREIIKLKGDAGVFLPPLVAEAIQKMREA